MRQLTKEQFTDLLESKIKAAGSQKAFAQTLQVSEAYLSDVLRNRREPGQKILVPLGLQAVTNYVLADAFPGDTSNLPKKGRKK